MKVLVSQGKLIRVALWAIAVFLVALSASVPRAGAESAGKPALITLDLSNRGSVLAHMTVSPSLRGRREEFADAIVRAHGIVGSFAARYGWQDAASARTVSSIEIFDTQAGIWHRLTALASIPASQPMPTKGLTATVEQGVLVAVTPEEYARVAPAYAHADPNGWERVMAHELIHELHRRILNGHDEAMGPQWFYEGFAVFGAGQSIDRGLVYKSAREALEAAHDNKSPGTYRRFVAAFRYFAARLPLQEMVARAGQPDFEMWLAIRAPR